MELWKINQNIFHRLNKSYRDDLNVVDIVITENIVDDCVRHFKERIDQWIYPSKSYFVAICYAWWIHEEFGDDFYEVLDDPELLFNNDPYFIPYHDDKSTYDSIIEQIDLPLPNTGMIPDVRQYFEEEILLKDDGLNCS